MFGKKFIGGGKKDSSDVSDISFAYEIPDEDIDRSSDWGKPNYDYAHSFINQKRFKQMLDKFHLVLYSIIGILLLLCLVFTFLLVFATHYEIAYVDDGTTIMCRVD